MLEQVARAIATADGAKFEDDPGRFRRLALAALKPMARPTEAMVDATYFIRTAPMRLRFLEALR